MTQAKTQDSQAPTYSKKDFMSDQDVRWCPGCGDYSILAGVQKVMPELGVPKEKIVFISGIGCAARFPYYMNTYGFHTIHGRAPALATGVKLNNPDLHVFIISGDGDALSIGGNHLIHLLRRNLDVNLIVFNNEVYGLTKGQLSPTSSVGTVTKTSPFGSSVRPVAPLNLAIGAQATFVARTADILAKHLQQTILAAHAHKGTSMIEALQNCHIFNDGVFKPILDKTVRDDKLLMLEAGKPMVFGKEQDKGIVYDSTSHVLKAVSLKDHSVDDLLVHDPTMKEAHLHYMLAAMGGEALPTAMGVIRSVEAPTYEEKVEFEKKTVLSQKGQGTLKDLLYSGETWKVD